MRRRQRKRRRKCLDLVLAPGRDRHHQRFLLDADRQSHLVTVSDDGLDERRRQRLDQPVGADIGAVDDECLACIDEDFQIIPIFDAESQPGLTGTRRLTPADEASDGGLRDTALDRADKGRVLRSRGIVENEPIERRFVSRTLSADRSGSRCLYSASRRIGGCRRPAPSPTRRGGMLRVGPPPSGRSQRPSLPTTQTNLRSAHRSAPGTCCISLGETVHRDKCEI